MATTTFHAKQAGPLTHPSLASRLRALLAVIRRQWVIFIRYPTWILALVVWPVIFPAGYILSARALAGPDGSGLAMFKQVTGTADIFGYIVIGTTVWMWQNMVLWNVGTALREDQLRGTLEMNWLSPTWRFTFLLGPAIAEMSQMFIFIGAAFAEFALLFGVHFQGSLFLALLVFLASIPSIYGLGMAFASLVIAAREANAFVYLVRGLVMVFCGITFPLAVLPGWMQSVAAWLPPTYTIHAMRQTMLSGAPLSALWPDLRALLGFGLFWLAAGYLMFRLMERRARRTGAIGQY